MKKYAEITSIPYLGAASTEPFAFKYYNPTEVVAGKQMKDHLKFAMSYWHTIDAEGADMFGSGTMDKSFG
ncbi:MAG TPA: xylose isomerase, partial [Saccharofermentans sp.]|nr:xylose isomerase [Saccharofermentans sp.]